MTDKKKKEEERGIGAPTKYKEEYCQLVMDLGKEGKSVTQIAVHIGVSRQTLYDWKDRYPDFLDALTRAQENAQAWYENLGQDGITMGKEFNSSTWAKQVSCRFPKDYTEKIKHAGDEEAPLITKIIREVVDPRGKSEDTNS